jgi:hypothetical protein
MNFGFSSVFLLIPVVVWLVALYLLLRFLRAVERAAYAHERIADALASQQAIRRGPRSDEGAR